MEFYESVLTKAVPKKNFDAVKKVAAELESENNKLQEKLEKESLRLEGVAKLKKGYDEARSSIWSLEENINDIIKEQHAVMSRNTSLKSELYLVKTWYN